MVDILFLDLLKQQKEPVSANEHDQNYAPRVFAPGRSDVSEQTLEVAMLRLLKAGKIKAHETTHVLTVAQPH